MAAVVVPNSRPSRDEWDDIPDAELEETLLERLEGLGEAVPASLRSFVCGTVNWSTWAVTSGFSLARQGVWIVATTSLIMFLPYIIEKERADIEKTQMAQQRQMLLGPAAAAGAKKN